MKKQNFNRTTSNKGRAERKKQVTKRETEIIQLVTDGYTDNEIAIQLNISKKTASTHRNNILRKLELKNTALLIRYAIVNKLVK